MSSDTGIYGEEGVLARVTRNAGALAITQAVEKIFNFALAVILARSLGEKSFGSYGFVCSYVALFSVFAGLGLSVICTREMSRRPDQSPQILTAALVPMAFSSALTFIVIGLSAFLTKAGQTDVITATHLAAGALVVNSVADIFDTLPRSREKMLFTAIPRVAASILLCLLCLASALSGIGLVEVFSFILLTSLVRLGMQIVFARTVFRALPSRKFDRKLCMTMLRESYPLALTSVFVIVYYKIDAVMLSYMKGDAQVGLYAAASNLALAFLFLAIAFHQASYPVLAKLFVASRERLVSFYGSSVKYLLIVALPIVAGMVILADRITVLAYGQRYVAASGALQILMFAVLLMFVNGLMGNTLIAAGDQKSLMKTVVIGATLNALLNLAVIPRYGLYGAAATTVAAELVAGALACLILRRKHGISASLWEAVRPIGCCAVMTVQVILCRHWPLPAVVVTAAILYFGLLFLSRAIGASDILMVRNLFARRDIT